MQEWLLFLGMNSYSSRSPQTKLLLVIYMDTIGITTPIQLDIHITMATGSITISFEIWIHWRY